MPSNPVFATLQRAWRELEPLGAPIAVMGGLALAAWKHVRATQAVNLLLGIEIARLGDVVDRLERAGFRRKRESPWQRLGDVVLLQFDYSPAGTFLDIQLDVLASETEYQQAALARRIAVTPPGLDIEIFVLACEDLILHKLIAGRIIDQADCAALLTANRVHLDREILVEWAKRLNLSTSLSTVWQRAFPGEPLESA